MYACMYDSESISSVQFVPLGNTSQNQISGKTSRNTVLLRLLAAAWPPLCQVKVNSPGEKRMLGKGIQSRQILIRKKDHKILYIYIYIICIWMYICIYIHIF